MHDQPFAILNTWTCYGTWLPGDRRGYVSNTRRANGKYERKQNIAGTTITADHPLTQQHAAAAQKFPTAMLDTAHARVAAEAMLGACALRQWRILRAAVMWNHMHVVVCDCPDNGPEVRRILKGVSQNSLSKYDGKPRRWWTAGGSDRYLHGEQAIMAAIRYVANQPEKLVEIADMVVVHGTTSERRGLSPPG